MECSYKKGETGTREELHNVSFRILVGKKKAMVAEEEEVHEVAVFFFFPEKDRSLKGGERQMMIEKARVLEMT